MNQNGPVRDFKRIQSGVCQGIIITCSEKVAYIQGYAFCIMGLGF